MKEILRSNALIVEIKNSENKMIKTSIILVIIT